MAAQERNIMAKYYTARELAEMKLPNMPATKEGMLKRAENERWGFREATGLGGTRKEFKIPSYVSRAIHFVKDGVPDEVLSVATPRAEYRVRTANSEGKPGRKPKGSLNMAQLQRIIITLETWIETRGIALKPERKATLITLLYHYFEHAVEVEESTLLEMIENSV